MGVRDRGFAVLAHQLAGPRGPLGRVVARQLDAVNVTGITAAVEHLDPAVGDTVADIGFGGGIGLDLLAAAVGPCGVVHGIDPMAGMIRRARRRRREAVEQGRLTLRMGVMGELPLPDATLDGAISCNTIYFMAELDRPFAELARVLRPTGTVVIGLADPASLRTRPFSEHGFVLRDVDTVVTALEGAGLTTRPVQTVDIGRGDFHLVAGSSGR